MNRVGLRTGGGSGIRTRDGVAPIHALQACAFNRSATPPQGSAREARPDSSRASRRVQRGPDTSRPSAEPRLLAHRRATPGSAAATGDGRRPISQRRGDGGSGIPARQRAGGAVVCDLTVRPFIPFRAGSPRTGGHARVPASAPAAAQDGNTRRDCHRRDGKQNPSHRDLPVVLSHSLRGSSAVLRLCPRSARPGHHPRSRYPKGYYSRSRYGGSPPEIAVRRAVPDPAEPFCACRQQQADACCQWSAEPPYSFLAPFPLPPEGDRHDL